MNNLCIWWLNAEELAMVFDIIEVAESGDPRWPTLPGHIKLVLRAAERNQFSGQLYVPVNLQGMVEPNYLATLPESTFTRTLMTGYFGVPFDQVLYESIGWYPGTVTSFNLKQIATSKFNPNGRGY